MKPSEHIDHLLHDLLEGDLDAATTARAEEHLAHCEHCRAEWTVLQDLVADVKALPRSMDPPRDLWDGIETRLGEMPSETPTPSNNTAPRQTPAPMETPAPSGTPAPKGTPAPAPTRGRSPGTGSRRADLRKGTLERPPSRRRRYSVRIGLAFAGLIAIGSVAWLLTRNGSVGWGVETLDGAPLIAQQFVGENGLLRPGDWLETDNASRARISVGTIGEVAVEPNTRVQLRRAQLNDHRIALAEGRIEARIWAPPRLFFVETPSATAIDLGCAYTLDVDSTGKSILHVTSGYVELERDGKSSVVPAGAMCYASPESGPGTVFSEDAPPALQSALERFDFHGAHEEDLDVILTSARPEDGMTLWQLVERSDGERRARIYGRLEELVRPPAGVTREGVLSGDPDMFEIWRLHLGLDAISWWGYLREKMEFPQ